MTDKELRKLPPEIFELIVEVELRGIKAGLEAAAKCAEITAEDSPSFAGMLELQDFAGTIRAIDPASILEGKECQSESRDTSQP